MKFREREIVESMNLTVTEHNDDTVRNNNWTVVFEDFHGEGTCDIGFEVTPCLLSWESDGGPEKGPLMFDDKCLQDNWTDYPDLNILTRNKFFVYVYITPG